MIERRPDPQFSTVELTQTQLLAALREERRDSSWWQLRLAEHRAELAAA